MKRTMITLLSFSLFLVSKAQVATFLSLGVGNSEKDAKGKFTEVKTWIIREMQINVDLDQKKVQFFSKGMLDSDTFNLRKEISILNEITSPDIRNDQTTRMFTGMDKWGRKCIVRLKPIKDEYNMQAGELRVEYMDRAEVYKLRTYRRNPVFNES